MDVLQNIEIQKIKTSCNLLKRSHEKCLRREEEETSTCIDSQYSRKQILDKERETRMSASADGRR